MAPVTKFASILLVALALGALQIAVPSFNPKNLKHPELIELPANTGSWQVANYQEAQRGSLFFDSDNTQESGLRLSPSLSTKATIKVSGVVARTQIRQTFHNSSNEWVNGLYVFPLPENAALDHLQMQIGERIIEGQIKPKQQAKQIFEQAKKEGKKASLISQQRPNLFTNSIANIGPNEKIVISIEYQQTIAYEHDAYQLRLPLTITPRYLPAPKTHDVSQATELEHAHYQAPENLVEDIDIDIRLDSGVAVKNISSDFHKVKTQKIAEGEYRIRLDKRIIANQDFVLRWQPELHPQPQVAHFQQSVNGKQYGLVMVYPPLKDSADSSTTLISRELIFVLDTSGSMSGASLTQAQQALLLALSDLKPEDHFNIIEFNSFAHKLWEQSKPAELAAITQARNFIVNLSADGGTEIASALELAFANQQQSKRLRQIVFITDGSVGNEESLMQLISENLQSSRLFTVGIGSAPNSYFMTEAAKMGKGTYTYIGSIEQVKSQMLTLLSKLAHPALTDIHLLVGDNMLVEASSIELYPNVITDLYLGEPLILSYRQDPNEAQAGALQTMSLLGRFANEPWKSELITTTAQPQAGLNVLWARQKIAQLSRNQRSAMLDNSSQEQLDKIEQELTQTALEHHLVSQYTSLIAVDISPSKPTHIPAHDMQTHNHVPKNSPLSASLAQLPQTATTAELNILLGSLLIGGALCLLVFCRKSV